jgi:hypothetical protein
MKSEINFEKPTLNAEFYGLPKVNIEKAPKAKDSKGTFRSESLSIKNDKGEIIGNAALNISLPPKGEPSAYLNSIKINEDMRGQGYGKSAYLEIIKFLGDIKLKTEDNFGLSDGAAKIWEWLELNGLALKIEASEDMDNKNNKTEYTTL